MTTAIRTAHIAAYTAEAHAAFEAGFSSKAQQKAALDRLNRAYEYLAENFREVIRETLWFPAIESGDEAAKRAAYDVLDVPFNLFQFTAKCEAKWAAYPEFVRDVISLRDLREAIKACEIAARPAKEADPVARAVESHIEDVLKTRREQYAQALDLGRLLGGLPVYANAVYCVNQHGTQWVRADYYLRGKRTPLNVIVAAYQQLVREGVIDPQ